MLLLSACGSSRKVTKEKGEAFAEFYEQFFADTTFQKSRIRFPLKGRNVDAENVEQQDPEGPFYWTEENWSPLYRPKLQSQWKEKWEESKGRRTYHIYLPNSGASLKLVFALQRKKWYLVYFSSVFI